MVTAAAPPPLCADWRRWGAGYRCQLRHPASRRRQAASYCCRRLHFQASRANGAIQATTRYLRGAAPVQRYSAERAGIKPVAGRGKPGLVPPPARGSSGRAVAEVSAARRNRPPWRASRHGTARRTHARGGGPPLAPPAPTPPLPVSRGSSLHHLRPSRGQGRAHGSSSLAAPVAASARQASVGQARSLPPPSSPPCLLSLPPRPWSCPRASARKSS